MLGDRFHEGSSEPDAKARDDAGLLNGVAGFARIAGGVGELAIPDHADIGSEFPGELVAQTQTGVDVREPCADVALGVVLAVEADLDVGLQDKPLRQPQVVLAFEAQGGASALPDVCRGLDVEPVRRQPLEAERRPGATGAVAEIVPRTGLPQ